MASYPRFVFPGSDAKLKQHCSNVVYFVRSMAVKFDEVKGKAQIFLRHEGRQPNATEGGFATEVKANDGLRGGGSKGPIKAPRTLLPRARSYWTIAWASPR